jgi:hypothetical protein
MASGVGQIERVSAPVAAAAGRRWAAVMVCGALIGLAVTLNQSAVHWRENLADSHLFAWHGWCISQGARPYLDIWDNKPPGIWWLNAAMFRLLGEGMGGELLICTAALTTALVAFGGIARIAYHRSILVIAVLTGCALLPHLTYEGGANRTETFVLACESLAVLAYVYWLRHRGWKWLVAAGLAAGAAPLFKQSGLAAAVAITLHLLGSLVTTRYRGRRREEARSGDQRGRFSAILVFAASCGVLPTGAVIALAAQGALGAACYAVVTFNRAYFEIGDATYLRVDRGLKVLKDVLVPLVWMFAAAVAGLVWGVLARPRGQRLFEATACDASGRAGSCESRTYVELFWLWFGFALYLACAGPGRRGHHLMPVLAPLGLLALYPVHLAATHSGLWRRMTVRPTFVAVIVVYLYALGLLAWDNAVEIGRCWQNKSHWYSLQYAADPGWLQQAREIRRLTRPDERIYVWGWSPGTYRYAYRRAASRYATLEKVGQLAGRADFILQRARQDLRANRPSVFVISPADLAWMRRAAPDDFVVWLTSNYEDRGVTGGMHIMVAR